MGLEPMLLGHRLTVIGHGQGQEMVLDIGIANTGPAADKAAAFEVIGRAQPILEQDPACADQGLGDGVHGRIERYRLLAGDLEIEFQMVL